MPLPYPSQSFTPFDPLTAAEMNELAANDQALAAGTGLNDGAVAAPKVANGFVVQVLQTDYSADTTGSTILPTDNTIPQNTEGFEVMSQAITPKASGNELMVEAVVLIGANTSLRSLAAAIFQDSNANALAATSQFQAQAAGDVVLKLGCKVTASSTTTTTFKVRIGSDNGGTIVGFGNGRFSTTPHSYIKVSEVVA